MYYTGIQKNEIFVGNHRVGDDLSFLSGINYRLGNQALDINGKPIPSDYMLPLFIAETDDAKYNKIMTDRLDQRHRG